MGRFVATSTKEWISPHQHDGGKAQIFEQDEKGRQEIKIIDLMW
jgi:hypothetical protein